MVGFRTIVWSKVSLSAFGLCDLIVLLLLESAFWVLLSKTAALPTNKNRSSLSISLDLDSESDEEESE